MLEKLYRPTRDDLVYGLQNRRVLQTVTDSQSSADFATADFYTVPDQYAFWLQGVTVELAPGGALLAASWTLFTDAIDGTTYGVAAGTAPDAAAADLFMSCQVNHLMLERETLSIRGRFSAGTSANVLKCEITGILFPRANIRSA